MYFNKEALLTVVNDRIEKYQEQVKSIRKNFNGESVRILSSSIGGR